MTDDAPPPTKEETEARAASQRRINAVKQKHADGATEEEIRVEQQSAVAEARARLEALKDRQKRAKMRMDFVKQLIFFATVAVVLAALMGDQKPVTKLEVVTLENQALFTTIIRPDSGERSLQGPNGPGTDWAVFFYKPYCGACRRVRPFFHALATSTNATEVLRFAEIDCVKHRSLCSHAGAKTHPMIKIFSAGSSPDKKFRRNEVGKWQGFLAATEIMEWFVQQPLSPDIEWPSQRNLSIAMSEFKKKVDSTFDDKLVTDNMDPRDAVDAAWKMSLHDAVFMREKHLEGSRYEAILSWLEALAYALPSLERRDQLVALREAMEEKTRWPRAAFLKLLEKHKVEESAEFNCAPRGPPSSNTGGYPCSLWLLFHTLLANSDSRGAPHVLVAIHGFVKNFFGCAECATHFEEYWLENPLGEDAMSQVDVGLWMWRAHNVVSRRLVEEEPLEVGPFKNASWPDESACESCFLNPLIHKEGYVFQFLQETYCYGSDSFPCATFVEQ